MFLYLYERTIQMRQEVQILAYPTEKQTETMKDRLALTIHTST